MKHIKLFENFSSEELIAISVFAETQMAVGVFPTSIAMKIYDDLSQSIPKDVDYVDVEMVNVPAGHDLVIVPLGGKGITTSNEEEMSNYGSPVHDVVELGKFYDYGENPDQMAFRVNPNVDGFVVLDSAGGTRLLSTEEIKGIIY